MSTHDVAAGTSSSNAGGVQALTAACAVLSPFVPVCEGVLNSGVRAGGSSTSSSSTSTSSPAPSGLTGLIQGYIDSTNEGLHTVLYTTIAVGAIIALLVVMFIAFLVWHEFFR